MATACDFKECQVILENAADVQIMMIDDKEYTMCIDCHKKFSEYLSMYLYGPVKGLVRSAKIESVAMPTMNPYLGPQFTNSNGNISMVYPSSAVTVHTGYAWDSMGRRR